MTFDGLETEFPRQADQIERLRSDDARLDEICADYELLLGDHRRLSETVAPANPSRLADIEEALTGLLEEIAQALGQKAHHARD